MYVIAAGNNRDICASNETKPQKYALQTTQQKDKDMHEHLITIWLALFRTCKQTHAYTQNGRTFSAVWNFSVKPKHEISIYTLVGNNTFTAFYLLFSFPFQLCACTFSFLCE